MMMLLVSGPFAGGVPSARAEGRFYLEFGGGVSLISASAGFFGAPAPASLGMGTALNGAAAIKLGRAGTPFDVHLGVAYRYASGSDGATSYALQAAYPILRFVVRGNVFLTLGATPYLWKRISDSPGFDFASRADGRIGALGELGYQWEITPAVSFALSGAAQTSFGGSSLSPMPSLELGGQIRLQMSRLFSVIDGADSGGGGSSYEGWRYPYGVPKN